MVISKWLGGLVAKSLQIYQTGTRQGRPNDGLEQLILKSQENSVVMSCLRTLAQGISEAPFVLKDSNGTVITNHKLLQVLRNPHPTLSEAQFKERISWILGTYGDCYVVKDYDQDNNLIGFYPYSRKNLNPVWGAYGIEYYQFEEGQTKLQYSVDRVLWFKGNFVDPLEPRYSLSPLKVAKPHVENYKESQDLNYSYLFNSMTAPGILSTPSNISEEQKESLIAKFRKQFSNSKQKSDKQRGAPIVTYGDFKFEPFTTSKDSPQKAYDISADEIAICSVYGIHPTIALTNAGLHVSTYNNLESAYREFTTLVRVPTWKSWSSVFTAGLKEFGLTVEFDLSGIQALQPDPNVAQQQIVALVQAQIISPQEARQELGYDAQPTPQVTPSQTAKSDFNDQETVDYWHGQEKLAASGQDSIREETKSILIKAIDRAIRSEKSLEGELSTEWLKKTKKAREKYVEDIIAQACEALKENPNIVSTEFDEIQKAAAEVSASNIRDSIGTVKQDVQKIISENAGDTEGLKAALAHYTEVVTTSRLDMILNTTTRAVRSETQLSTWKKFPYKVKVQWISRRDKKVRPKHRELDGQIFDIGEKLKTANGELRAPGLGDVAEDVINCRCALRPIRA